MLAANGHQTKAFSTCNSQKKAYRANSESKDIYVDKNFGHARQSLMNVESLPFDIISRREEVAKMIRRPDTHGYCGKVNGISDFKNISILTAPNFNKDY